MRRGRIRPVVRATVAAAVLSVAMALAGTGVASAGASSPPAQAERQLTAMTYNLYLGANLTPLFTQTGLGLIAAAGTAYAHVGQVDFPARAAAIAKLVSGAQPDVIGLQEVALWKTAPATPTQAGPVCPAASAFTTTVDYLAILQSALSAAGHPYRAVSSTTGNFSGTLPISLTTCASFTDHDVILVRDGMPSSELKVEGANHGTYTASMTVPLNGTYVPVPRGWSSADLKVRGKTVRFFDTHLEAYSAAASTAQAHEFVQLVDASPYPVVAVGDFNSTPDDTNGAYGVLTGAGLVDSWPEAMGSAPGFTSGQTDDLTNIPSQIDHRIDLIFHSPTTMSAVDGSGDVVGEAQADMTTTSPPLWPSDHAGVVMTLALARP